MIRGPLKKVDALQNQHDDLDDGYRECNHVHLCIQEIHLFIESLAELSVRGKET
jgi:hypothetical protein